eukprot:4794204-Pyramimonas_sp.AAC.1
MVKMTSNNPAGRRVFVSVPSSAVEGNVAPKVNTGNRRVRPPALMPNEGAMRSIAEEFHNGIAAKV